MNWCVWFNCKPHHRTMNTYPVYVNTKLVLVYYNEEKPNIFKIYVDVILYGLKDHQDQMNGRLIHKDTKRVDNVEYRRSTHTEVHRSPR